MLHRVVRAVRWLALIGVLALAAGCAKHAPSAPGQATRSWHMGFSALPPTLHQAVALQVLALWAPRADAAISHEDVPWDSLLAGVRPDSLALRLALPLAQYYRGKGFLYAYEIDPTNGINRAAEAAALVRTGHSIGEPRVQALFRQWAAAVDSVVAPDWLGLASETNLIRLAAPASLYADLAHISRSAADTLATLHARWHRAASPVLYTTVQVETAWGRLGGAPGYQGIATDLADFPFGGVLGLSSYPYLGGFAEPESIPTDYYARIGADAHRPVMVVEGGWSSASLAGVETTPQKQARYIRTQGRLLAAAHAIAWWQLTFTDLALSTFPPLPPGSNLLPFASTGLVDTVLAPKPALAPWDSLFALPRVP